MYITIVSWGISLYNLNLHEKFTEFGRKRGERCLNSLSIENEFPMQKTTIIAFKQNSLRLIGNKIRGFPYPWFSWRNLLKRKLQNLPYPCWRSFFYSGSPGNTQSYTTLFTYLFTSVSVSLLLPFQLQKHISWGVYNFICNVIMRIRNF